MLNAATLLGMALLAQRFGTGFAPPSPPSSGVPSPPMIPAPLAPSPSPPVPPPGELPRGLAPPPAYGAAGSSDITGALALSTGGGWGTSLGYRRFVVDGIAPGLAVAYFSFGTLDEVWLLASLRIVPLRTPHFGLALTPQAGRVFVWGYSDGWAYGGAATATFAFSPHFALEVGLDLFFFGPASFSRSVSDSVLYQPTAGIVVFL